MSSAEIKRVEHTERIVAVVAARMGSSRMFGKSMAPLAGKPSLAHIITRIRRSRFVDAVVVATTTAEGDDVIRDCARENGALVYSGSADDVLGRTVEAGRVASADILVIVDGDTPLIDPDVLDDIVEVFLRELPDYAANTLEPSFPWGFEVQVCRLTALSRINDESDDPAHHEHVTLALYEEGAPYRTRSVTAPPELAWPELRLTLDTPEDHAIISAIFDALHSTKPDFGIKEVVAHVRAHPELLGLNASIQQKPVR